MNRGLSFWKFRKRHGESVLLDTAVTLGLSVILGLALFVGMKGVIKNSEGKNLTTQLYNELTTQVVDCNFDKWETGAKLVKAYPDPTSMTLWVGQKKKITFTTAGPENLDHSIKWSSADPNIASVDDTGTVTGMGGGPNGSGNKGGDTYVYLQTQSGARTKIKIHVDPFVYLHISPNTMDVFIGTPKTISYSTDPAKPINSHITWVSSNPSIATVDSNGTVTGLVAGTVTITGTTYTGGTDVCTVTVKPGVPQAPINLNVWMSSNGYLYISWTKPYSYFPITSYTVKVGSQIVNTSTVSTSVYYPYSGDVSISVCANNQQGSGPWTSHLYNIWCNSSMRSNGYTVTETVSHSLSWAAVDYQGTRQGESKTSQSRTFYSSSPEYGSNTEYNSWVSGNTSYWDTITTSYSSSPNYNWVTVWYIRLKS